MRRELTLHLVTGRFPQLSELFVYRKAVALARRGHRVRVLARADGDDAFFPDALPPTLTVQRLAPDNSLRHPARALAAASRTMRSLTRTPAGAVALYRECATDPRTREDAGRNFMRHLPLIAGHPDVIHFEFLGTAAMYPLVKKQTGVPIVVSCRGSDIHLFDLRPASLQEAMLATLRDAAAVHCVSEEIGDHVAKLLGAREKIHVNRPAVDTQAIRPRTWDVPSDGTLRIVTTGRLSWHKAFDYLLAAFARLRERGVRFTAKILGDGELLAPLRFSCTDLGLDGIVEMPGGVSSADVLAALQTADLFVLPSHNEGISNATLEAMASGVPVVSTRVGGMPEAIEDGLEGLLVPPRDAMAMASAIERLACDPALRVRMGQAARKKAETAFTLDRQVNVFEEIYRSVREARR